MYEKQLVLKLDKNEVDKDKLETVFGRRATAQVGVTSPTSKAVRIYFDNHPVQLYEITVPFDSGGSTTGFHQESNFMVNINGALKPASAKLEH